jgi:hypothetical protein
MLRDAIGDVEALLGRRSRAKRPAPSLVAV